MSVARPSPETIIGVSVNSLAFFSEHNITDAAPSHIGAQSISVSGSAMIGELTTDSRVISFRYIACLLKGAFL
ncbi:MAG: hypothetical protein AMQ74_00561 [Candidatus Methanofastidiosum methylothiophilum]|uniref:Uncharacterized protein n=1 Tax=Candidatus Methanofastidiosum methylothiophilum TaxID=1705564 RepID=A0A150J6W4_9EURY|nr:MAG: hypothetical protein AMQ74_00561 [Candidatus Methanofastidiosum methylthiophilus]